MSRIRSSILIGVDAYPIDVETQIFGNLKRFSIVGLPDSTVREARERVRCALENSGFSFPDSEVIVSLAPASLQKSGAGFDLAIALSILSGQGQFDSDKAAKLIVVGELSLDGQLKPAPGALSTALMAVQLGYKEIIVPKQSASQAALVSGLRVYQASSLAEVVCFLRNELDLELAIPTVFENTKTPGDVTFADVVGQHAAKRACEIVAAGGHNLLMVGPPGAGKTMLSKCLVDVLPELKLEEAIEVVRVHSSFGSRLVERPKPDDEGHSIPRLLRRPFRCPHHSISVAGLIGGGTDPVPGEISLAHKGILFLDEFTEFRRDALEALRQPLESKNVSISRARMRVSFPCDFSLVAAMNPCPCGRRGTGGCECSSAAIRKYRLKISGPILDRIDLRIWVPALSAKDIQTARTSDPTSTMRTRILQARQIQAARFHDSQAFNSRLRPREIRKFCCLDAQAEKLAHVALEKYKLSARGYARLLKVSRTIADLEGSELLREPHVAEALSYRIDEM